MHYKDSLSETFYIVEIVKGNEFNILEEEFNDEGKAWIYVVRNLFCNICRKNYFNQQKPRRASIEYCAKRYTVVEEDDLEKCKNANDIFFCARI